MQSGVNVITAHTRFTAQGSVIISVSRKQNCLPRCLIILHLWKGSTNSERVFTKQMQDMLDEYVAENRLPDKELDDFYEKMKQDVMSFVYALKAEAE